MIKRALFAVAGFLSLCPFVSAQQSPSAEQPYFDGSTLDRSVLRRPSLTLEDEQLFFFSTAFGSVRSATNFLAPFNPAEPRGFASPTTSGLRNSPDRVVELRPVERIYTGGEIGFLYGRSRGKYGREFEQGYIVGELGTDRFRIIVGTSYERSSGRVPRWVR